MDTTTLNQLIETAGIIFIAVFAFVVYSKAVKWKYGVGREITLLKDIIFFRTIIEKYIVYLKENNLESKRNKFRQAVEDEIGFSSSVNSEPKRIQNRLEQLQQYDESIDKFISKITISNN